MMTRLALVSALVALTSTPAIAQPPRAAERFRRDLVGNVRLVWGLSGPVATMAAQVHQESAWRPDAKSAYAGGLAQFTPDTADWISQRYSSDLGANQPFNPAWALRALAVYDKHIYDTSLPAATECDRWAFVLAAYNGGPGWVTRDRKLASTAGADPSRWWGHVERFTRRAAWAMKENRDYPRKILLRWQPLYRTWGLTVTCEDIA